MIDVALTPAALRASGVAVVIDVLRATSTATQALASGYERVLCAESIERARELRSPGRVLAGEEHCRMPVGFDQGNSPLEASAPRGSELVLATTNGAPAIVAAALRAGTVLLACVLNLDAVVKALLELTLASDSDIQLVCSGTNGAAALEDVYLAGRVCARLTGDRTDAARIAQAVTAGYRTPLQALSASEDARILRAAGMVDDIAYCARESVLDLVPVVEGVRGTTAVLAQRHAGGPGSGRSKRETAVDQHGTVSA